MVNSTKRLDKNLYQNTIRKEERRHNYKQIWERCYDVSIEVELEYVPAVEHFENYKN